MPIRSLHDIYIRAGALVVFDLRYRFNIGPKSIFFFVVFCTVLFLSVNWKLSYQVSKDMVTAAKEDRQAEVTHKAKSRTFDETHRKLEEHNR
jgi:hypothetical protein